MTQSRLILASLILLIAGARTELCNELPHVDRGAMHRLVADDAVRFFDQVLPRALGRAPVQ